jgi:hypothetical protein
MLVLVAVLAGLALFVAAVVSIASSAATSLEKTLWILVTLMFPSWGRSSGSRSGGARSWRIRPIAGERGRQSASARPQVSIVHPMNAWSFGSLPTDTSRRPVGDRESSRRELRSTSTPRLHQQWRPTGVRPTVPLRPRHRRVCADARRRRAPAVIARARPHGLAAGAARSRRCGGVLPLRRSSGRS